jgi:hypothetical protein
LFGRKEVENGRENRFCWYTLLVKSPPRKRETKKSWNIRKNHINKILEQGNKQKTIKKHGSKTNIQSNVGEKQCDHPKYEH